MMGNFGGTYLGVPISSLQVFSEGRLEHGPGISVDRMMGNFGGTYLGVPISVLQVFA